MIVQIKGLPAGSLVTGSNEDSDLANSKAPRSAIL